MLILTQKEIKKILPLKKIDIVINAVQKAFSDYGQNKVQMPAKLYLYFKEFNGDLRIMPSFSETLKLAGTKIVNVHPDNYKKRLKSIMAVIVLNDARTGLPLTLMDGTYITALRTGAASAVATKYLARKEAKSLGVIGAGSQAITQILAIAQVRKLSEILVYDINEEAIKNLEKILANEKIKIKKASLKETAQKDILVTITPAKKPIIKKEWILPGTHINAIGADAVGKEELDPQILKKAKIIVDDWAQASHSGEINVPLKKGILKKKDVYAYLSEIICGKKIGRKNNKEITIFDSTGLAVQDLYTANIVYNLAKKKKLGKQIKII
ncbi:MAG TPA: ornithine cyclodeaminase family protein [Candidatus Paceibacterota bacterium]|nr:ornithine cyclodeaminase family protein [Candidatus Pacearchaeota archaeon]HPZ74316.1 ornithine cyclodeaminase family protein [Candidatus Pacearchaeota archaeon]HQD88921.1 ornithine cyclodeaminase family protein [Candidatus Pacearchaeota archaeon]HRR39145.1 ornithine cyclodeaminase family protein [Candidatus Paceibacterota bacterium]